jgi:tRNA modification GTPase
MRNVTLQALPGMADTIAAIATPAGRGAVALIRMSGMRAIEIAGLHVQPWPLAHGSVRLCELRDGEAGALLDRALVTVFCGPRSFTGEHVVEFATHGGYTVPESVLAALVGSGARQATAGEFTLRAFANGKLDLMQAEAVADLIDAGSRSMQSAALAQLDGALTRRISALREALLTLEAQLAYNIDFPEEDDAPVPAEAIEKLASDTLRSITELISTGKTAEVIRTGAIVVIAGSPNVGKSSLFNALVGYARAIVTEIPGTTRDALEAVIEAGKFPIRLIDTAGLRESEDRVEQLGIESTRRFLHDADIVLACGDSVTGVRAAMAEATPGTTAAVIPVYTKVDLVADSDKQKLPAEWLTLSTVTGEGLQNLLQKISSTLERQHSIPRDSALLTRARHVSAVRTAASELTSFIRLWREGQTPASISAVHVRTAEAALEELIGVVEVEHVLDKVLSSFCVGK